MARAWSGAIAEMREKNPVGLAGLSRAHTCFRRACSFHLANIVPTHAPCKRISAIATSSTPCATRSCRPRTSRTCGATDDHRAMTCGFHSLGAEVVQAVRTNRKGTQGSDQFTCRGPLVSHPVDRPFLSGSERALNHRFISLVIRLLFPLLALLLDARRQRSPSEAVLRSTLLILPSPLKPK